MSSKGQTINDRLNAAKYTLAGQALARCIFKATTEELMKPKKKHLDYLAASTYESNVSMMQLANILIERTNHSNWAVVYKALITVHHLMSYGNERFTQYLASSNYSFQLSGFLDRVIAKGYAMSTFIRRYSNYINQKALSYRTLAIDLCRIQRGNDNVIRTMPIERLLETLPIISRQLDALLDFDCTAEDLSNSIITASFNLLFHDAIRLFASYNDGIINLFEKYFDLNKKLCREAFESYKRFLASTDKFAEFLKVAEALDLNRGELPDFKRAPSSLLDAFEQHLISLESNKKRDKIVVDAKSVVFPSFSVNNDTGSVPKSLADISKEFEAQLGFATDDFGLNEKVDSLPKLETEEIVTPSPITEVQPVMTNLTSLTDFGAFDSTPFSDLNNVIINPEPTIKDLFETKAPSFVDDSLLKPEGPMIPSNNIVAPTISRHNNNNNNVPESRKTKKESLFEDLEFTMRQSLKKA